MTRLLPLTHDITSAKVIRVVAVVAADNDIDAVVVVMLEAVVAQRK